MKNLKNLFAIMFMIAALIFTSCEEDEKEKTFLEKLDLEMASDIDDMKNAEGFKAIAILNNLDDPFSDSKGKIGSSVFNNLQDYLVPFDKKDWKSETSKKSDGGFMFSQWVGVYEWDNTAQRWDVDWGGEKIILKFPSNENNLDVNDATLTIHSYEEIAIWEDGLFGGYYDYYPTLISADLYIDEVKYIGLDLDATWGDDGEPYNFDMDVYLMPYTFTGTLDRTSTTLDVDYTIKNNQTLIFGIGVDGTFTDETYEYPITISGYVQYRSVVVDATVQADDLIEIMKDLNSDNPTYTLETGLAAINEAIDATVKKDGDKVADIVLKLDDEEGLMFVLVYTNGDEENAEEFFESFLDHIEELLGVVGVQLEDTFGDDGM